MLRIFRTRARQLFRSTARGRENNRYRETANGSNTVTYIPGPAHRLSKHRAATREYQRVLASETPITRRR